MKPTRETIMQAIRPIDDPELGMSLVDMGLIYKVDISKSGNVAVEMTLSSPACPVGPQLISLVKNAVLAVDGVRNVDVELVWDPPWNPAEMATDEVKDALGIW